MTVSLIEKGDFKAALYWIKECYQPLEEARFCAGWYSNHVFCIFILYGIVVNLSVKLFNFSTTASGGQQDVLSEVNVLKEDLFLAECRAESLRCITTGMLKKFRI